MSPYPTVVMVTTAHQNPSGIDLNWDLGDPASAKYTVLENSTTPAQGSKNKILIQFNFSLLAIHET